MSSSKIFLNSKSWTAFAPFATTPKSWLKSVSQARNILRAHVWALAAGVNTAAITIEKTSVRNTGSLPLTSQDYQARRRLRDLTLSAPQRPKAFIKQKEQSGSSGIPALQTQLLQNALVRCYPFATARPHCRYCVRYSNSPWKPTVSIIRSWFLESTTVFYHISWYTRNSA